MMQAATSNTGTWHSLKIKLQESKTQDIRLFVLEGQPVRAACSAGKEVASCTMLLDTKLVVNCMYHFSDVYPGHDQVVSK